MMSKPAMYAAEKSGDILLKIELLRIAAEEALSKGWSESAYSSLEEARMLALSTGHFFEELQILTDEVKYLIDKHNDTELYMTAISRIKELDEVFDMPDDDFKVMYKENYHSNIDKRILGREDECFKKFYGYYDYISDYLAAHINYTAAIVCCKAMNKLAVLTDKISIDDRVESLFKTAIDYGNIREVEKAIEYYNSAIRVSRDAGCAVYEYLALQRKLSICLISAHITPHVNVDSERLSVIKRLIELCDEQRLDPNRIGEKLLEEEMRKAKSGTRREKEVASSRVNKLREAIPILNVLLALSRGDMCTAKKYIEKLKEAEKRVYNPDAQYSNADAMMQMYQMMYNSEERNEVAQKADAEELEEDGAYTINFPDGMFVSDKHRTLIMYARNEMLLKHPQAAESLSLQAANIAAEVNSDYHAAMALHSLGQSYETVGNIEEALKIYAYVVNMFRSPEHPESDITLSNCLLYTTLFEIGNITKETAPEMAVEVLSEAIDLSQSRKSDEQLFLICSLICRAEANGNMGNIEAKERDCEEALSLLVNVAKSRLPFMEGELRENYWVQVCKQINDIVSLLDGDSSPSLIISVYEAVLMAKGFLLSAENAVKRAVLAEPSLEQYLPLYKEIEKYEAARRPWGASTEDSSDEYLRHYMKTMKLLLATKDVIGKYYDFMNVQYRDISDAMDDGKVVIDYYDYPLEDDDRQYVAFVYKKGDAAPSFVKVCKESDLKKIYDEVADNKLRIYEAYNIELPYSASIYELILSEVVRCADITSVGKVAFVPSGSLHKIPVESLAVKYGSDMIVDDAYEEFVRISHVRTLLDKRDSELDSIALFGALDYGGDVEGNAGSRGYALNSTGEAPTPLVPWESLAQTGYEVKSIGYRWRKMKKDSQKVAIYIGNDGTAKRFEEVAEQGCSVLHIATHGFCETIESKENLPALQGTNRPMDLTGLVMSNGNKGWLYGDKDHHEGILLASDIALMNLSRTKLVVLSACNTGDGEVRSDGLFGLQRAFKKAGAESLVMSLWREDDKVGADFMSCFYSYMLSGNMDKRAAFNLAKKEIRKYHHDPQNWANFIMVD